MSCVIVGMPGNFLEVETPGEVAGGLGRALLTFTG